VKGARRTERPCLEIDDMRPRDWRRLSDSLPRGGFEHEAIHKFLGAVTWFSAMDGYLLHKTRQPYGEHRVLYRRIWKGLANRPYRAGPFRLERVGRWDFAFFVTAAYAEERRIKRRTRRRRIVLGRGGFDSAFEVDFQRRRLARASELEVESWGGI